MSKFKKGESGNVKGRPPGIVDRRVRLRESLEPSAPALIQRVLAAAMAGNMVAARLILDRICPILKPISLAEALDLDLSGTPTAQARAVLEAAAAGKVSIDDACQLLAGIAASVKIHETAELEARLIALENAVNQGG